MWAGEWGVDCGGRFFRVYLQDGSCTSIELSRHLVAPPRAASLFSVYLVKPIQSRSVHLMDVVDNGMPSDEVSS